MIKFSIVDSKLKPITLISLEASQIAPPRKRRLSAGIEGVSRIEFPYGISQFLELRRNPAFFFVDKTSFIHELEAMPRNIIVHRPPRWGKSTLMSMLSCYYDISLGNKFTTLFGGLDIGKDPTESKNSCFVLELDLSLDVDSAMDSAEIRRRLEKNIFDSVILFAEYYKFPIPVEPDSKFGLGIVAKYVQSVGGNLLFLIDEYDRFSNKLMFEDPEAYRRIIVGTSGDRQSSPIRGLFEAVKDISHKFKGRFRSIVTGITPVALSDAAGGNIWYDISQEPIFGDLFGFSDRDLYDALSATGLCLDEIKNILNTMREYYNGYRFPGSTSSFYNPALSLSFLFRYFTMPYFRQKILNVDSSDTDLSAVINDKNVSPSQSVFAVLARSPVVKRVCAKLLNRDNPVIMEHISSTVHLRDLMDERADADTQEQRTCSFMYYHGLATLMCTDDLERFHFKVPNRLIRGPFLDKLMDYLKLTKSNAMFCLENPTAESIQNLLQGIVDGDESRRDNAFSEAALQTELEAALRAVQRHSVGFSLRAERDVGKRRYIVCISKQDGENIVLELKRIRPKAIDYSSNTTMKHVVNVPGSTAAVYWSDAMLLAARQYLEKHSEAELRGLRIVPNDRKWYMECKSVEELEGKAEVQCADYMSKIYKTCTRVKGYTVIQVGWKLLVKSVSYEEKLHKSKEAAA